MAFQKFPSTDVFLYIIRNIFAIGIENMFLDTSGS